MGVILCPECGTYGLIVDEIRSAHIEESVDGLALLDEEMFHYDVHCPNCDFVEIETDLKKWDIS